MKVTIIGGGGRVGSCAAYALQCGGLVSEIQILDANKDLAEGEALDNVSDAIREVIRAKVSRAEETVHANQAFLQTVDL